MTHLEKTVPSAHQHEAGAGHHHHGEHPHAHAHEPEASLAGRIGHAVSELFGAHSHDSADRIDEALEADAAGRRVLWLSLAALAVTAAVQAGWWCCPVRWRCWATRCTTWPTRSPPSRC